MWQDLKKSGQEITLKIAHPPVGQNIGPRGYFFLILLLLLLFIIFFYFFFGGGPAGPAGRPAGPGWALKNGSQNHEIIIEIGPGGVLGGIF